MWSTVVIVGGGGCTGRALLDVIVDEAKASKVVLTSRSGSLRDLPKSDKVAIEVAPLDMINGDDQDLARICEEFEAEMLFCCLGLQRYHVKAWGPGWPKISDRLLLACKTTGVPLIFMDNLYAFGPEGMHKMPLQESDLELTASGSKTKPQVRAAMTRKFLAASEAGEAKIALVRASDFFGPRCSQGVSVLSMLWDQVLHKKTPTFLGNPKRIHAQTYVPDVARALVRIAENPDTWGRAWHVPTLPDKTMIEWVREIYSLCGRPRTGKYNYMRIDGLLMYALSWFTEDVDGLRDVAFMWRDDYTVSSADFLARFPDFETTPVEDALGATAAWFEAENAK